MADHNLFFERTGMDRGKVQQTVDDALHGADDGELFLEYSQSESFAFDDGRLKAASFDTSQGFGLRAVAGEATGYAHATELSEEAILRAARTVRAVSAGHSGSVAAPPAIFAEGQSLPVVIDGREVGRIAVADILPPPRPRAEAADNGA